MIDIVGTSPFMRIALWVAMETQKIPFPLRFFEDFFSIKQDIFLILKLLLTFFKELVVGEGSFSAKCPRL